MTEREFEQFFEQHFEQHAPPEHVCFCRRIVPEVTSILMGRPGSFSSFLRDAQLETLKVLRTLIDERINYLARSEQAGTRLEIT
jgi:hypothetical protein